LCRRNANGGNDGGEQIGGEHVIEHLAAIGRQDTDSPQDVPRSQNSQAQPMIRLYTKQDLSDLFDEDLIWRRKELSDMKSAVRAADAAAKPVLLRAIITMSYTNPAELPLSSRSSSLITFAPASFRRWER
jgi:hypothetical protein